MCEQVTMMRRGTFQAAIQERGGIYIRPEENRQPNPACRIASIHLDGILGIGQTEEQAQKDWLARNAGNAIRASGVAA